MKSTQPTRTEPPLVSTRQRHPYRPPVITREGPTLILQQDVLSEPAVTQTTINHVSSPLRNSHTSRVRVAMDSRRSRLSVLFALIGIALAVRSAAAAVSRSRSGAASVSFIKSSCRVTRYPDLCVASLSPYVVSVRAAQSELVKVAVNVSLLTAHDNSAWARALSQARRPRKRERAALEDCIENFGDTSDQIKNSLAELKHLRSETFLFQMSNVQTWLSAAITNEDSCLDGFQELRGSLKPLVSRRVRISSMLISNALALVNNLAARRG